MILLREIVAVVISISAIIGVGNIALSGFNWADLLVAVICFGLAYIIWPSKKKGQRYEDGNSFLDLLEWLIELPGELFLWLFRLLGRYV